MDLRKYTAKQCSLRVPFSKALLQCDDALLASEKADEELLRREDQLEHSSRPPMYITLIPTQDSYDLNIESHDIKYIV